jgi:DNA-binding transcriptional LysR family regulator
MNLRQLEVFCSVIRCKTTIAAARELGMSQPAVSNAIKAMEQNAGFRLFERFNGRLFPTAEAQLLYDDAQPLFSIRSSLATKIEDLKELQGGHLRLLASPPLGYGPVPAALHSFLSTRKKVRVSCDVRRIENVIESVEMRVVDLGLVLGYDEQPNLESSVLFNGEMVCVFPSGHPLARKETIRPADVAAHPFIALERAGRIGSLGKLVRQAFSDADCKFNYSVEVRNCHTACILADAGLGASIVDPFSAAFGGWRNLAVRPFRPSIPVAAHSVWLRDRPLSRLAQAFVKEVSLVARRNGSGDLAAATAG